MARPGPRACLANLVGAASVFIGVHLLECQILMLRGPAMRLCEPCLGGPDRPSHVYVRPVVRWLVLDLRPWLFGAMTGAALLWVLLSLRLKRKAWLVPGHYALLVGVVFGSAVHIMSIVSQVVIV